MVSDPNDLYAGYSPSEASRQATLDDYIADFQVSWIFREWSGTGLVSSLRQLLRERGDAGKDAPIAELVGTTRHLTRTDQLTGDRQAIDYRAVECAVLTTEQRY